MIRTTIGIESAMADLNASEGRLVSMLEQDAERKKRQEGRQ